MWPKPHPLGVNFSSCDDSNLVLCTVWCGLRANCVFTCFQYCAMINQQWPLHYHFYNHMWPIVLLRNRPTVRPYPAQVITLHMSRSPGLVQLHRSYITREQGHGRGVDVAEAELGVLLTCHKLKSFMYDFNLRVTMQYKLTLICPIKWHSNKTSNINVRNLSA